MFITISTSIHPLSQHTRHNSVSHLRAVQSVKAWCVAVKLKNSCHLIPKSSFDSARIGRLGTRVFKAL